MGDREEPRKRYVTWFELTKRCEMLADVIAREAQGEDGGKVHLVAIARGGSVPARLISGFLEGKGIKCGTSTIHVESYEGTKQGELKHSTFTGMGEPGSIHYVVDDLVDSGKSMQLVLDLCQRVKAGLDFQSVVVYYKPHSVVTPSIYAEVVDSGEWIVFPYETEDQE